MANTLIPQEQQRPRNPGAEYEANGEKVRLSAQTVVNYLVSGNGKVNEQEVMMFIQLCKYRHLNPFIREAYLVKYNNSPATMIVGKDVFLRRAKSNPSFRGMQAGIYVLSKDGELSQREGVFYIKDMERLVGGWCKVFVDGWETPFLHSVPLDEYLGRKNNGEINSNWTTRPATMIRKVAIVQALRDVFPETNAQLYSAEEMGVREEDLPTADVEVKDVKEEPKAPAPEKTAGGAAAALFGGAT